MTEQLNNIICFLEVITALQILFFKIPHDYILNKSKILIVLVLYFSLIVAG